MIPIMGLSLLTVIARAARKAARCLKRARNNKSNEGAQLNTIPVVSRPVAMTRAAQDLAVMGYSVNPPEYVRQPHGPGGSIIDLPRRRRGTCADNQPPQRAAGASIENT
jgi:hypothetical protein